MGLLQLTLYAAAAADRVLALSILPHPPAPPRGEMQFHSLAVIITGEWCAHIHLENRAIASRIPADIQMIFTMIRPA